MPVQKVFNGTDWVPVDSGEVSGDYIEGEGISKIFVSGTQPTVSESGDLWLDTATQSASGIAYLPLSAGSSHHITGDLYLKKDNTEMGIYLYYGDTKRGGLYTGGSTGSWPTLYVSAFDGSTRKATLILDSNNGYSILSSNEIYLRPTGDSQNSTTQILITSDASIRLDSANGQKISKRTNSSEMGYFYFSPTGYLDIWSNNVTQIRTGTGHQSDDTVRFIFGTTGVLTAPGMYTTTRSGSTLVIDSNGAIGRTSSLRKYKKDITPITNEDAIKGYELNPITYTSALEYDLQNTQYGLIAEEVEEVLPNLCTYDIDGNIDGVAYDRVCAILLKQNQMLKAKIDILEEKVAKLEMN